MQQNDVWGVFLTYFVNLPQFDFLKVQRDQIEFGIFILSFDYAAMRTPGNNVLVVDCLAGAIWVGRNGPAVGCRERRLLVEVFGDDSLFGSEGHDAVLLLLDNFVEFTGGRAEC